MKLTRSQLKRIIKEAILNEEFDVESRIKELENIGAFMSKFAPPEDKEKVQIAKNELVQILNKINPYHGY